MVSNLVSSSINEDDAAQSLEWKYASIKMYIPPRIGLYLILLMAIVLGPKYDECVFDIWCTHSHVDKLNELIPNVHSVKTNNKTKQKLLKYFNFQCVPTRMLLLLFIFKEELR